MLHIPEHQFLENVLHEVHDARHHFPTNENLVETLINHVATFPKITRGGPMRYALVVAAALITRIAVEGDPAYKSSMPSKDDPLAELLTEIETKGK